MDKISLINKLNDNNNFHLTLKSILITDDTLINEYKLLLENKCLKIKAIINDNDLYNDLKDALNYDYVLINEKIDLLIPLVVVITKDEVNVIKPIVNVFYMLKDNKIIQHIKTTCNKMLVKYFAFKNKSELFIAINKEVGIDE